MAAAVAAASHSFRPSSRLGCGTDDTAKGACCRKRYDFFRSRVSTRTIAGLHSWYRLVPFSIFISHEAGGSGREERIRERGFEIETETEQREAAASQRRVYRRGRDDAFSCLIHFSIAPSERKRERPSTLAVEDSAEENFTLPQERRTRAKTAIILFPAIIPRKASQRSSNWHFLIAAKVSKMRKREKAEDAAGNTDTFVGNVAYVRPTLPK